GYQAYAGSIRGARGTLWSGSGNALDIASLGVALMRASGIPAQYSQGMISQSQAQTLIRSMLPPTTQTVGFLAPNTPTSDPAFNFTLVDDALNHYWFQFNAGSGMKDADPLFEAATDTTATSSTGTFDAVPADQEETTRIQVVAEIYNQATAAFGLSDPFTR